MPANSVVIRTAVFDAIKAVQDGAGFIQNGFDLEQTYLPYQRLPDIPSGSKVWVISLAKGDDLLARSNLSESEFSVQIALQKIVDVDNIKDLNELVELEEQLRDTARKNIPNLAFTWLRNEALKDENDTPYSYIALREGGYFEAYFTAFYKAFIP